MIETTLISKEPVIVCHRISGIMTETEAEKGVDEALLVINEATEKGQECRLVLDVKEYRFNNVEAHRIWSVGLRENEIVKTRVKRVAVIGSDTPVFRAEKELMASDRFQFFNDTDAANRWIEWEPDE